MAGRPRKVIGISTGKIGKEKIKARQDQEKKIKLDRDQLEVPKWLTKEGKKEFERVVKEAGKIDLLDNLDLGFLAIYCNAYACYIDISKQIQKLEKKYLGDRMSKFGPYETVHPLLIAQEKYVKQIMQCSTKLGLATTDRLKLIVPVKEEKEVNKFLKYV